MPYDDPTLKEFAGYFEAKEPGRRERADAWADRTSNVGREMLVGIRRIGPDKGGHWEVVAP